MRSAATPTCAAPGPARQVMAVHRTSADQCFSGEQALQLRAVPLPSPAEYDAMLTLMEEQQRLLGQREVHVLELLSELSRQKRQKQKLQRQRDRVNRSEKRPGAPGNHNATASATGETATNGGGIGSDRANGDGASDAASGETSNPLGRTDLPVPMVTKLMSYGRSDSENNHNGAGLGVHSPGKETIDRDSDTVALSASSYTGPAGDLRPAASGGRHRAARDRQQPHLNHSHGPKNLPRKPSPSRSGDSAPEHSLFGGYHGEQSPTHHGDDVAQAGSDEVHPYRHSDDDLHHTDNSGDLSGSDHRLGCWPGAMEMPSLRKSAPVLKAGVRNGGVDAHAASAPWNPAAVYRPRDSVQSSNVRSPSVDVDAGAGNDEVGTSTRSGTSRSSSRSTSFHQSWITHQQAEMRSLRDEVGKLRSLLGEAPYFSVRQGTNGDKLLPPQRPLANDNVEDSVDNGASPTEDAGREPRLEAPPSNTFHSLRSAGSSTAGTKTESTVSGTPVQHHHSGQVDSANADAGALSNSADTETDEECTYSSLSTSLSSLAASPRSTSSSTRSSMADVLSSISSSDNNPGEKGDGPRKFRRMLQTRAMGHPASNQTTVSESEADGEEAPANDTKEVMRGPETVVSATNPVDSHSPTPPKAAVVYTQEEVSLFVQEAVNAERGISYNVMKSLEREMGALKVDMRQLQLQQGEGYRNHWDTNPHEDDAAVDERPCVGGLGRRSVSTGGASKGRSPSALESSQQQIQRLSDDLQAERALTRALSQRKAAQEDILNQLTEDNLRLREEVQRATAALTGTPPAEYNDGFVGASGTPAQVAQDVPALPPSQLLRNDVENKNIFSAALVGIRDLLAVQLPVADAYVNGHPIVCEIWNSVDAELQKVGLSLGPQADSGAMTVSNPTTSRSEDGTTGDAAPQPATVTPLPQWHPASAATPPADGAKGLAPPTKHPTTEGSPRTPSAVRKTTSSRTPRNANNTARRVAGKSAQQPLARMDFSRTGSTGRISQTSTPRNRAPNMVPPLVNFPSRRPSSTAAKPRLAMSPTVTPRAGASTTRSSAAGSPRLTGRSSSLRSAGSKGPTPQRAPQPTRRASAGGALRREMKQTPPVGGESVRAGTRNGDSAMNCGAEEREAEAPGDEAGRGDDQLGVSNSLNSEVNSAEPPPQRRSEAVGSTPRQNADRRAECGQRAGSRGSAVGGTPNNGAAYSAKYGYFMSPLFARERRQLGSPGASGSIHFPSNRYSHTNSTASSLTNTAAGASMSPSHRAVSASRRNPSMSRADPSPYRQPANGSPRKSSLDYMSRGGPAAARCSSKDWRRRDSTASTADSISGTAAAQEVKRLTREIARLREERLQLEIENGDVTLQLDCNRGPVRRMSLT